MQLQISVVLQREVRERASESFRSTRVNKLAEVLIFRGLNFLQQAYTLMSVIDHSDFFCYDFFRLISTFLARAREFYVEVFRGRDYLPNLFSHHHSIPTQSAHHNEE